jgi:hypothetical protein
MLVLLGCILYLNCGGDGSLSANRRICYWGVFHTLILGGNSLLSAKMRI